MDLTPGSAAHGGPRAPADRALGLALRRCAWVQASLEVTRSLLSDDGAEPTRVIARRLQELLDADAVEALGAGTPEAGARGQDDRPLMVLHLSRDGAELAVLVASRLPARPPFDSDDRDLAVAFVGEAGAALELADARASRERGALLADRDRIARDLHDHVMQRLFGAGLTVESIAAGLGTDPRARRLAAVVHEIDETIAQIRTSIFQLRGPLLAPVGGTRSRLLAVAAAAAAELGFDPALRFVGPIDAVVPSGLVDDLAAVLREALSNVAQHAGATSATVSVTATGSELVVLVDDDGAGLGATQRRSGLDNLRRRAEAHGGHLALDRPATAPGRDPAPGTRLRWTVPL
ncbi:sensor histidine kinase [Motilibacter rhizosphaerae]|uniref:sensor histidine kinase n=1 Tax=Motilibacter rhizosphaerae TaxID=598652 RepID=UPI0013EEBA2C|nr:histidine kinase [Motilibacter rhizosphaerae]